MLNAQLDAIRSEAATVDKMEVSILDLRRKKDLEEANYRYYAASLEKARIDEALGAGRVSNISQIQTPSPPFTDRKNPMCRLQLSRSVALSSVSSGRF